jgi:hypothetical protein
MRGRINNMKLRQEYLELAFSFLEESVDWVIVEVPDLVEVLESETIISELLRIRIREVAEYNLDKDLFEILLDSPAVRREGFLFSTPIGSVIFVDASEYEWPNQWCPEVLVPLIEGNPDWLRPYLED